MARLYARLKSDAAQTERTITGNQRIIAQINYGTKEDSRIAAKIDVIWLLGCKKPTVAVTIAEELRDLKLGHE